MYEAIADFLVVKVIRRNPLEKYGPDDEADEDYAAGYEISQSVSLS